MLVARFLVWAQASLWKGSDWDKRMAKAIVACIIIHNICVEQKDPHSEPLPPVPKIFDPDNFIAAPLPTAIAVRHQLALFIYSQWTLSADGHVVRR